MDDATTWSMPCPVCEGRTFQSVAHVFDDRYGEPSRYRLARCTQCGHLATAPRLDESALPVLYGTYYPRKGTSPQQVTRTAANATARFARLRRWWQGVNNQGQYLVRPGEIMLDIGCGSGTSLLEAQALGAQAFGIEADPNVRPIAHALGLNIHFGSLHDDPFPDQRFDLVVLNQVIEHLPEPDRALRHLRDRLTQNGRIALVFPNVGSVWRRIAGLRWINWHIPYHLHHFDRAGFARMADRCGYRVHSVRTITPNLWTLLQVRASRTPAQHGVPHPLWAVRPAAVGEGSGATRSAGFKTTLRLLVLLPIALLNRTLDALGLGDSLMVVLHPKGIR